MIRIASPLSARIRQAALLVLQLGCMMSTSGCYYYKSIEYHRVANKPKKFRKELRYALDPNKYIIVHQGKDMWHLGDMVIDMPAGKHCNPNLDSMYGNAENVDSLCAFYYYKYIDKDRRAVRYSIDDDNYVTSQVHVYVADNTSCNTIPVSIPLSAINRVDVYKQDAFRSQWPWVAARICLEILLICASPNNHGHSHSHSSHSPRNTGRAPSATHVPRNR